jgi:prefoldin subunit 5
MHKSVEELRREVAVLEREIEALRTNLKRVRENVKHWKMRTAESAFWIHQSVRRG